MNQIESVINAAREYGAESVRHLGTGVVHVSFRRFDGDREIGFLEVRVGADIGIVDHRQSPGPEGQRWAAHVSDWVLWAGNVVRASSSRRAGAVHYPSSPWSRSSESPGGSTLFN